MYVECLHKVAESWEHIINVQFKSSVRFFSFNANKNKLQAREET